MFASLIIIDLFPLSSKITPFACSVQMNLDPFFYLFLVSWHSVKLRQHTFLERHCGKKGSCFLVPVYLSGQDPAAHADSPEPGSAAAMASPVPTSCSSWRSTATSQQLSLAPLLQVVS